MSKFLKGAVMGGLMGAGYVGYKSYTNDEPVDDAASEFVKVAGGAAAVGGLVGLMLDRRARKNLSRAAMLAGYATSKREDLQKMSKKAIKEGRKRAKHARPQIEQALETVAVVAETARPMIEGFAEQAKPVAKDAAKEAASIANETYVTLRPHATKAAKSAAKHAGYTAKRARKLAVDSDLGRSVLVKLN